jgi:hypothetical protein
MTVRRGEDGVVALSGACSSDDAEHLLQSLTAEPELIVDLRLCEGLHTAVLQVLLASRAPIRGPAAGAFVRRWLEPALQAG